MKEESKRGGCEVEMEEEKSEREARSGREGRRAEQRRVSQALSIEGITVRGGRGVYELAGRSTLSSRRKTRVKEDSHVVL